MAYLNSTALHIWPGSAGFAAGDVLVLLGTAGDRWGLLGAAWERGGPSALPSVCWVPGGVVLGTAGDRWGPLGIG